MIEKILSKIENLIVCNSEEAEACYPSAIAREYAYYECKEIVQEVAKEYGNGWIPVEVSMPEEHESIFAKFKDTEKWDIGMFEKCSDDVNVTVEYTDGTRKTKTLHTCDGIWKIESVYAQYTVIAWQPLPAPYQKGE